MGIGRCWQRDLCWQALLVFFFLWRAVCWACVRVLGGREGKSGRRVCDQYVRLRRGRDLGVINKDEDEISR